MKKLFAFVGSVLGVPVIVLLYKFFTKGPDEPMTVRDGLAIFSLQLIVAIGIMMYVLLYHAKPMVLGG